MTLLKNIVKQFIKFADQWPARCRVELATIRITKCVGVYKIYIGMTKFCIHYDIHWSYIKSVTYTLDPINIIITRKWRGEVLEDTLWRPQLEQLYDELAKDGVVMPLDYTMDGKLGDDLKIQQIDLHNLCIMSHDHDDELSVYADANTNTPYLIHRTLGGFICRFPFGNIKMTKTLYIDNGYAWVEVYTNVGTTRSQWKYDLCMALLDYIRDLIIRLQCVSMLR